MQALFHGKHSGSELIAMAKLARQSDGSNGTETLEVIPARYIGEKSKPFDAEAASFIVYMMTEHKMTLADVLRIQALAWPNGVRYSYNTIWAWMQRSPGFAEDIACARSSLAEQYFTDIVQTVDSMTIDSVAVDREKIRAKQWLAKVTNPQVYGDRKAIEQDVRVTHEERHIIDVAELSQDAREQLRSALLQAERLALPKS